MVAGFIEPTAGHVKFGGNDVTTAAALEAQRRHGVPELRAVPAPDGGRERGVRAGDAQARRRPTSAAGSRRRWRWSGSRAIGGRLPRQLSGGQQQRVALARALAIRPDVLLLDEPLSNLDAKLRQEVRVEIRELQRQLGLTTVMVTHDQEEALDHGRPAGGDERGRGDARSAASAISTSGRPTASSRASSAAATFLAGTVEAPGRFRTEGGLAHRLLGGTAGPRRRCRSGRNGWRSAATPRRRTRQQPRRYGGIRLLSRRADRHPCAPVAQRQAGGADRQPRGRLLAGGRPARPCRLAGVGRPVFNE